jgi:hypothetical protein
MNTTDLLRLSFIMNLLGKRIIPCYFYKKNPLEVIKWQFNACRQTAVICAQVASELLYKWGYNTDKDPDAEENQYRVQIWDGMFMDEVMGEYNHAWVFLEHKLDPDQDVLIDTARVSHNIGVKRSGNSPAKFLCDELSDTATVELSRQEMSWKEVHAGNEYYTHMNATDIYRDIRSILNLYLRENTLA